MCSLLIAQSLPAERQRGLIFCERFDSVDSFYKNDGTIAAGTPLISSNKITLSSTDDVLYNSNYSIRGASPSTAMCWMRPTAKGTNYRIALAIGSRATYHSTLLALNASGFFMGTVWGGADIVTTITPDLYSWYHIAYTYSGSGSTFCVYVNGVSNGWTSSTGITQDITTSAINVGNQGSGFPFTGDISHIRVFNKQLSAEEILAYSKTRS
jgi:hypothetical protein